MPMIIKGFRFGLLLQIAIGPVCIYVIKTAVQSGIPAAEAAVAAATIVDAVFVALAILGIGALLDRPHVKGVLKYLGALVLLYFGAGIILGSFGVSIIPGLGDLGSSIKTSSAFVTSFVLTASSPLTILFWTGVFASKMTNEGYSKKDMALFGTGSVLTTLTFLGTAALFAGMLQPVMTPAVINVMNAAVGVVLILFAAKMGLSRAAPVAEKPAEKDAINR